MSHKTHVRFLIAEMIMAALCLIVLLQRQNQQDTRLRTLERAVQAAR